MIIIIIILMYYHRIGVQITSLQMFLLQNRPDILFR